MRITFPNSHNASETVKETDREKHLIIVCCSRYQETDSRVEDDRSPDPRSHQGQDSAPIPPGRRHRHRGRGEEGPGERREGRQPPDEEQHRGNHHQVGSPGGRSPQHGMREGAGGGQEPRPDGGDRVLGGEM